MSIDPELEREYSPSSVSKKPATDYIVDYGKRSRTVVGVLGDRIERCAYGPGGDEYVILARHSTAAPLLVFIHGGYWRALSADECCMWAADALDMGVSFASINYTLAPTATLDRIVTQCRMAMDWIREESGLRPARTVVSGSSAGGHLAAMVSTARPTPHSCDAVVLLSGVFDLRPLVNTGVNEAVSLTVPDAVRLSPAHARINPVEEARTVVGFEETDAFKSQSADYAAMLASAGVNASNHVIAGCDHFDLIYDLITPGTVLGDMTIELLKP